MSSSGARTLICIFLVGLALAGCATRQILVSQWSNAGYASHAFGKIMVAAVTGQTSVRRTFEDEFVARLKAAGLEAIPSYRYLGDSDKLEQETIKQVALREGADGAIVARPVGVEQRTEVAPSFYPTLGFYGRYGSAWYGWYDAPRVYRYDVFTSETTLYDLAKNQIVWTGTVQTMESGNVNAAIRRYVDTVMRALHEQNLLTSGERQ